MKKPRRERSSLTLRRDLLEILHRLAEEDNRNAANYVENWLILTAKARGWIIEGGPSDPENNEL